VSPVEVDELSTAVVVLLFAVIGPILKFEISD